MEDCTKRGTTGHGYCTRAGGMGGEHPDEAGREISRPTAAGRAGIGPAKRAAAATVSHRKFPVFWPFSGHFRLPHSSFPPFLDLLNSSTRSLFADSTPFGSYNKNKIGRSLDRVFRPPQRLFDQGNGTIEFLVSWAFH